MRCITTALERIALCKRMRRSLVRFSEPASYVRSLSWGDFIINTFGFSFRYTQASAGLEGGLDRERLDGYITAARRLIWKTPWRSCKTSEKSPVKSATTVWTGATGAP